MTCRECLFFSHLDVIVGVAVCNRPAGATLSAISCPASRKADFLEEKALRRNSLGRARTRGRFFRGDGRSSRARQRARNLFLSPQSVPLFAAVIVCSRECVLAGGHRLTAAPPGATSARRTRLAATLGARGRIIIDTPRRLIERPSAADTSA